jgi:hypothetical protein
LRRIIKRGFGLLRAVIFDGLAWQRLRAESLSVILCAGHNRGEGEGYAEQIEESVW